MGSCASVHHRSSSSSSQSTAIKADASFGSKIVIQSSPIKDKPHSITTFGEFGSKEENFFDSQNYLESDCDDDFYSVNGDFTPSCGNTPVHHSFATGTPGRNNNGTSLNNNTFGSTPELSPKKKLVELFQESVRENQIENTSSIDNKNMVSGEVKQTILDVLPKSPNGTPYASGPNSLCSSERTANGDDNMGLEKEKTFKSVQCCLPSLISCRRFTDRKKKMSPGAIAVNRN